MEDIEMKFPLLTLCMFGMIGCVPDAIPNEESTAAAIEGSKIPALKDMQQAAPSPLGDGTVHPNAWSDCPSGFSCYWDLPGALGQLWVAPGAGWWSLNGMRDRISAVWNRGNGAIDFYNCWDQACTGADYMTTVGVGVSRNLDAFENKADIIFIH
jgi:peptidase inhibitor family I36